MKQRPTKAPWSIEVEYHNKPSAFYAVRKMVLDVKEMKLLVDTEGDLEKISIPRGTMRKVLVMPTKEEVINA